MSVTVTTRIVDTTGTLTAEIITPRVGDPYLLVVVDGEKVVVSIREHLRLLHEQTVTDEAARLLQRHAGCQPVSDWTADENGRMTATVAEMTGRCATCVHGCGHSATTTNCGHYRCPGRTTDTAHANSCDGAAIALGAKRPSLRSIAGRNFNRLKANPNTRRQN